MSQKRLYSTDRDTNDQSSKENEAPEEEANTATSKLASTFGFQSLSGLFQEPPRGRYSRPRRPERTEEDARPAPEDLTTQKPSDIQAGSSGFFTPVDSTALHESTKDEENSTVMYQGPRRVLQKLRNQKIGASDDEGTYMAKVTRRGRARTALARGDRSRMPESTQSSHSVGRSSPRKTSRALSGSNNTSRGTIRIPAARARPNPFTTESSATAFSPTLSGATNASVGSEPAWGLSRDDEASVDSILEPDAYATELLTEDKAASQFESRPFVAQTRSPKQTTSKSSNAMAAILSPDQGSHGLTHVKATGEAHMVDVGQKESTKRVALAFSSVRFSNEDPARLISEDSNKKGDVLGVARIAGIMAAKRTSDLIPLCHPLAISKVEVDLQLHPIGEKTGFYGSSLHGSVSIVAQVECTGPTGVEMEALTAASAAALTVFDMCKAVDRGMSIIHTKVVYKSGGRSGTHADKAFTHHIGRDFFIQRGLERPDIGQLAARKPQDESQTNGV